MLRLRRPFVVVDEAHNSRTELAFDMLARLRPSGVMELTATPDLERTPSNVLHSVSAAELKAEEMIKLPVVLQTEPNWQQCLADAIGRRNALHELADEERRAGSLYLRPLVLIQSEPRRAGVETLDFERGQPRIGDLGGGRASGTARPCRYQLGAVGNGLVAQGRLIRASLLARLGG